MVQNWCQLMHLLQTQKAHIFCWIFHSISIWQYQLYFNAFLCIRCLSYVSICSLYLSGDIRILKLRFQCLDCHFAFIHPPANIRVVILVILKCGESKNVFRHPWHLTIWMRPNTADILRSLTLSLLRTVRTIPSALQQQPRTDWS